MVASVNTDRNRRGLLPITVQNFMGVERWTCDYATKRILLFNAHFPLMIFETMEDRLAYFTRCDNGELPEYGTALEHARTAGGIWSDDSEIELDTARIFVYELFRYTIERFNQGRAFWEQDVRKSQTFKRLFVEARKHRRSELGKVLKEVGERAGNPSLVQSAEYDIVRDGIAYQLPPKVMVATLYEELR